MPADNTICLIGGPTATGKTSVAVELASRWQSEVVSADSMQVYQRLSIGTAKPTPEETRGVAYHLIDCLEPTLRFSAAQFLDQANPIINRLHANQRTPVVAGGTGLYLAALRDGLFEQPPITPDVRAEIEERLDALRPTEAHALLAEVDPTTAANVHPNDRVRIVRALEVHAATGRTVSELRREGRELQPPRPCDLFILNSPRAELYGRIDARAARMFDEGLIEETERLLGEGLSPELPCMRALGYRHVAELIAGRLTREDAIAAVAQTHRNYAKRQLTWFRKMKDARWVTVTDRNASLIADEIEKSLESRQPRRG